MPSGALHRLWLLLLAVGLVLPPVIAQDDTVLRDEPQPTRSRRQPRPNRPRKRTTVRYVKGNHREHVTPKIHLRYRLSGTVGWLNRDDKIAGSGGMRGLTMDRPVVLGGTAAVEFLPTGQLKSLQQWNNASIGLAFSAFDLGQKQYLGQAFSLYSYLNVPLVHCRHFVFGLRPGIGLGFVTKTYANTVPSAYRWQEYQVDKQQIANISMGSVVNAFLMGGIYMDFPIKKGWDITFSIGWQHLSNGSVMTPNGGYNMFNAELGAAYTPKLAVNGMHRHQPYSTVPHALYDGVKKKWDVEIQAGGGVRSVYYKDKKWFGVATISVSAHWIPISIFRIGGGVDVFYDGAYAYTDSHFKKTYIAESKVSNCFRVGVSLQPEMVLGRFSFGYHLGVYLFDPVKNMEPYDEAAAGGLHRGLFYGYDMSKASTKQDGWFYQKVQLKYLVSNHIFVHLGLKVHIMKAEFIDLGVGVRI